MATECGPSERERRHVLLIEDDPDDARLVEEALTDPDARGAGGRFDGSNGAVLRHERELDAGLDRLVRDDVDLLLLGLGPPESSGIEALVRARERFEAGPVVVLAAGPASELGLEAVTRGAHEYLPKDAVTPEALNRTIEYAIERNRIELALRRRGEELAALNRLTDHDVRNDVSLVVGRAREIRGEVGPRARRLVDEILGASNHVLQLTRTAENAVESIEGGEQRDPGPVDLRRVVTAEAEAARALYERAIVEVEAADEAVQVRASGLLSPAVANLIGDAVRYNDEEIPQVTVSVEHGGETATVRVADNGPGVPEYHRDRLFAAPGDGIETGTRVGRYLVGRLVDQYGGDVAVENRQSGGSVFSVRLPLA